MKKLLSIFIVATMILTVCPVFAAESTDATYYAPSQRCVVKGTVENLDEKDVTLLLTDSSENVVYAQQTTTNYYGDYEFLFKYNGDMSALTLKVRQGGENINNTVKTALALKDTVSADIKLGTSADESGASAVVSAIGKYGALNKCTVILALYDAQKNLISSKTIKQYVESAETTSVIADAITPETVTIKAFVWDSLSNLIPITDVNASTPTSISEKYDDNMVIGVIGDSITASVGTSMAYSSYLEYLYKTRMPEKNIIFYNKGIAGDAASGAQARLNWDVFSKAEKNSANPDERSADLLADVYGDPDHITIMLGTNSIGYNLRAFETTLTPAAISAADRATSDLSSLIDAVIAKGISADKITVLSTMVGRRSTFGSEVCEEPIGTNLTYDYMTSKYKALAQNKGVKFVDVHTPMMGIIKDNHDAFQGDGIHLPIPGHIVTACEFAKAQGFSPIVAQVEVDASKNTAKTINADATNVNATATSVTYKYAPKALPLATVGTTGDANQNSAYANTINTGYNVTDEMNKELIVVKNLVDGNYNITLNGTIAGTYSASELANGVNIATLDANPGQVMSRDVYEQYCGLNNDVANIRRIYANTKPANGSTNTFAQAIEVLKNTANNPFVYSDAVSDIQARRANANSAVATLPVYTVSISKVN